MVVIEVNNEKAHRQKAIKSLQLFAMCDRTTPFKPRDASDEAILKGLEQKGLVATDGVRYWRNKYGEMLYEHFVFAGGLP